MESCLFTRALARACKPVTLVMGKLTGAEYVIPFGRFNSIVTEAVSLGNWAETTCHRFKCTGSRGGVNIFVTKIDDPDFGIASFDIFARYDGEDETTSFTTKSLNGTELLEKLQAICRAEIDRHAVS